MHLDRLRRSSRSRRARKLAFCFSKPLKAESMMNRYQPIIFATVSALIVCGWGLSGHSPLVGSQKASAQDPVRLSDDAGLCRPSRIRGRPRIDIVDRAWTATRRRTPPFAAKQSDVGREASVAASD